MKTETEIGTLLEMLDAARWDLAIDVDDSEDGRTVWVTIRPRETSDTRGQSDFSGKTILEALQKTVAFTHTLPTNETPTQSTRLCPGLPSPSEYQPAMAFPRESGFPQGP